MDPPWRGRVHRLPPPRPRLRGIHHGRVRPPAEGAAKRRGGGLRPPIGIGRATRRRAHSRKQHLRSARDGVQGKPPATEAIPGAGRHSNSPVRDPSYGDGARAAGECSVIGSCHALAGLLDKQLCGWGLLTGGVTSAAGRRCLGPRRRGSSCLCPGAGYQRCHQASRTPSGIECPSAGR